MASSIAKQYASTPNDLFKVFLNETLIASDKKLGSTFNQRYIGFRVILDRVMLWSHCKYLHSAICRRRRSFYQFPARFHRRKFL